MKARVSVLMLLLFVSCGASPAEVKAARDTTYSAEPVTLFNELKAATEQTYKIAAVDETTFAIRTAGRWYTPEGQVDTKAGTNPSSVQDKSINLAVLVGIVRADSRSYKVIIEPIVLRKNGLSSAPEALKMTDPTVPGWVRGKLDSLQVEIHHRLERYAVTTVEPATERPSSRPSSSGW